jgi:hypothetical protein
MNIELMSSKERELQEKTPNALEDVRIPSVSDDRYTKKLKNKWSGLASRVGISLLAMQVGNSFAEGGNDSDLEKSRELSSKEKEVVVEYLGEDFLENLDARWNIDVPVTIDKEGVYVVHIEQTHRGRKGDVKGVIYRERIVDSQKAIEALLADIFETGKGGSEKIIFAEGYMYATFAQERLGYIRSFEEELEKIDFTDVTLENVNRVTELIKNYSKGNFSGSFVYFHIFPHIKKFLPQVQSIMDKNGDSFSLAVRNLERNIQLMKTDYVLRTLSGLDAREDMLYVMGAEFKLLYEGKLVDIYPADSKQYLERAWEAKDTCDESRREMSQLEITMSNFIFSHPAMRSIEEELQKYDVIEGEFSDSQAQEVSRLLERQSQLQKQLEDEFKSTEAYQSVKKKLDEAEIEEKNTENTKKIMEKYEGQKIIWDEMIESVEKEKEDCYKQYEILKK